jgi:hypothetical protein
VEVIMLRIPSGALVVFLPGAILLWTPSSAAADELTLSAAKAFGLDARLERGYFEKSPAFLSSGGGGAEESAGGPASAARFGRPSAKAAMGFTLDPDTFLLAFGADFFVTNNFNLGPLLELGVRDDRFLLAPTLSFQWLFDLPAPMEPWKPFLQWGLGLAYLEEDNRLGRNDETGFLANFGFGFEYCLTNQIALGNSLLFNFLLDEVLDQNFFFSWQFVTVRFTF